MKSCDRVKVVENIMNKKIVFTVAAAMSFIIAACASAGTRYEEIIKDKKIIMIPEQSRTIQIRYYGGITSQIITDPEHAEYMVYVSIENNRIPISGSWYAVSKTDYDAFVIGERCETAKINCIQNN